MHHADEFRALVKQLLVFVDQKLAGIVDRHDADSCAFLFRQHLPRHDVRMVLERRQDDFVARADELAAIAVHHEVDRIGRAAGEDHFAIFARVDEALQLAARFLVFGGRGFGQIVHTAIDVGMLRGLVAHQTVDHRLRHLAGCRVVEIDQRLAADLELEDRKIGADALNVECRGELRFQSRLVQVHGSDCSEFAQARCCSSRCLSDATDMRSMISAPNAYVSRLRAAIIG